VAVKQVYVELHVERCKSSTTPWGYDRILEILIYLQ